MTTTTAPNQTTNTTQVTTVLTVAKIASGRTQPGATNWQKSSDYVYVDVDTSAAGFAQTPVYVTSIGGDSNHFGTTGASSVYSATATGFRIFLRWDKDYKTTAITPEEANGYKWHINWIAIEPFSQQGQGTRTQPFPDPQKYYYIGNKKSGKVIGVAGGTSGNTADGAKLIQWAKGAAEDQQWRLEDAGNGYFYLINKKSSKLACVTSGSTADGAKLHQWAKIDGADDEKWRLEDAGNGYFYLINKKSSKLACVTSGSTADGAELHQWAKIDGADDQKWKFEAI
jgi:hypothetical protein